MTTKPTIPSLSENNRNNQSLQPFITNSINSNTTDKEPTQPQLSTPSTPPTINISGFSTGYRIIKLRIRHLDISNNPYLNQVYGSEIPVVLFETKELSRLKVNGPDIRRGIEEELRNLIATQ